MTISAHGSRRIYDGATRHIGNEPAVATTFFDELHPHLRNQPAISVTGADLIYEYLKRRPERTLAQIGQRTGHEPAQIRRLLEKEPQRFVCLRGRWSVIEQPTEAKPLRQTLPQRVTAYLADHGPATASEIMAALDVRGNAVFEALARGIPNAVVVGTRGVGRCKANVWGLMR